MHEELSRSDSQSGRAESSLIAATLRSSDGAEEDSQPAKASIEAGAIAAEITKDSSETTKLTGSFSLLSVADVNQRLQLEHESRVPTRISHKRPQSTTILSPARCSKRSTRRVHAARTSPATNSSPADATEAAATTTSA